MHTDSGGMKKPGKDQIADIFEVTPGPYSQGHLQYCQKLDARGVKAFGHGGKGNVQNRWHGTGIKCTLGLKGQTSICTDKTCATCNIIRSGFDISYCRTPGRYGIGLYASATSSKAHQYAAGMSKDIGGREVQTQPKLMKKAHNALIVCSVAVGNGYKEASATWGGPNGEYNPENCSNYKPNSLGTDYDSVLAETGASGGVNFDEVAVYQNEAIIPRYLVAYRYP